MKRWHLRELEGDGPLEVLEIPVSEPDMQSESSLGLDSKCFVQRTPKRESKDKNNSDTFAKEKDDFIEAEAELTSSDSEDGS